MRYLIIFIFVTLLSAFPLTAQMIRPSDPPSFAFLKKSKIEIPSKVYDSINTHLLIQQDAEFPLPLRYGICRELRISLQEVGLRDELPGKGYIRRFLIVSSGAKAIGLNLDLFRLPPGSSLWLYDPDHTNIVGAVVDDGKNQAGPLTLPEVPGDSLILEYFEPGNAAFAGQIELSQLIHTYRDKSIMDTEESSGLLTSNIATRCPASRPYWNLKHSVCRMTFNDQIYAYLCTGFLVNNTAVNGIPYFVTANHCINTEKMANTLVTYFNYEDASCNVSGGSLITINGAKLLFTLRESDFTLLRLDSDPPPSSQPVYAGWDVSDSASSPVSIIHHPEGKSKVISVSTDAVESMPGLIYWEGGSPTPSNSHWRVKLTSGKTVGGSSGCPLFDKNNRAIGQLHGGDEKTDYFGKLAYTFKMQPDSFVKYLDPIKSGVHALDGYIPSTNYPESFFDINLKTPCLNEPVRLVNQSLFNADKFIWEFRHNETGNLQYVEFLDGTNFSSGEPVVQFTERGSYTVSLSSGNNDSIRNQTSRFDFVVADTALRLTTSGIPVSGYICGNQLNNYLISTQGALEYSYTFGENSNRLFISGDMGVRKITLDKAKEGSGSFLLPLTISGSHGNCAASTQHILNFRIASNNEPENSIMLQHGLNGPFSNECADTWESEPYPQVNDCYGQLSWCSPEENYGILQNTVWFKIPGPSTGKLGVRLTGLDAQMALYDAGTEADLRNGNARIIAANDNQLNTKEPEIYPVKVSPGKDYWLQVDGSKNGQVGPFSLIVLQDGVTCYPNPTKGPITVEVGFDASENIRIEISELQGRRVRAFTKESMLAGEKLEIDLSDLPRGMYLIHFSSSSGSGVSKILKL